MVIVRKSSGNREVESLDILAAVVKVVETNLQLEEKDIELPDGRTFSADPNLSLRLRVEENLVEPNMHVGATFWDRFKLKKGDLDEWFMSRYSKLGNLLVVRYGESWFDDLDAPFEEEDFQDWSFACRILPKTNPRGERLRGSTIDWQSMHAVQADPKVAQAAEAEADGDFSDIPF
jgi:hypothetical protein